MNDRLWTMENYWGQRCESYSPGCPCCEAWRLHDANGVMPGDDEVDAAMKKETYERRPDYIERLESPRGPLGEWRIKREDLAVVLKLWRKAGYRPRILGRNHFSLADENGYRHEFLPC